MGIDFAGNIGYLANGTETFKINFISQPSTTTTTPTSSTSISSTSSKDTTPTTSNPVSTASLNIWIIFVSILFFGVYNRKRKRNL
ncbi:MAG: hypothetical protein HeimC3_53530 [Candidatus Heimdallarchaeota archaeon LC_3]|nr:MAG: hypothetical protein HeimC3_53530 [Candidatus Heimdallarchaeota archaeon LC_3]